MSAQAARQMLHEMAQDQTFESLMSKTHTQHERLSAIVEAGREKGIDFSSEDVLAAAGELEAGEGGALSEDQLDMVAGGKWWHAITKILLPRPAPGTGRDGGAPRA